MSSPVVAFVSLFLSLTIGVQPVEVLVNDEVARVELWLDAELVGIMRGPSWTLHADFGRRPEPHHLVAVALDGEGGELDRVEQWINLPNETADADLIIERDDDGRAFARLTWTSIMGDEPLSIAVTMDGRELDFDDPKRVPLPDHDPEQLHFLRAELDFEYNVTVVEELTFGGSYGDDVSTDLTALPILLPAKGAKKALPSLDELQQWFASGGEPVRVAAVDDGPAHVMIIRDRAVQPALDRLIGGTATNSAFSSRVSTRNMARFDAALKRDQRLAFFWPFMVQAPSGLWMFPHPVGWMSPQDGGVGWFLSTMPPPPPPDGQQLLADAVAVAGMNSLTWNRRRAVVLILGRKPRDASRLTPRMVRHYLETLRVPLFVWSPFEHSDSPWGEVTDISTLGKLRNAVSDLARQVDRQRIVWFEGLHLPNRIRLTERARAISFPG